MNQYMEKYLSSGGSGGGVGGGGAGGAPPPPPPPRLFSDETEARRAENKFWRPTLRYLKVLFWRC